MTQIDLSNYKALYLKTANEYLDKLTNSLTTLKTNPADQNAISEAHLAVHSLGSQSYTMGYNSIADLSRALEAFFHTLKENKQTFPQEYFPGIETSIQKIRDSVKSIEIDGQEQNPIVNIEKTLPATSKNISILLAEDDKFFQNFYAQKLSENGMTVEVAMDGQIAIEKLKTLKPDLILLDLIMPNKNGFEVLQEISTIENLKGIPILVFSTLEQKGDIDKAIQLGATGYVNKTFFDFNNLLNKIHEVAR